MFWRKWQKQKWGRRDGSLKSSVDKKINKLINNQHFQSNKKVSWRKLENVKTRAAHSLDQERIKPKYLKVQRVLY